MIPKFTYVYIGMGPEFFNNMDSPNNAFGAEDSKAWKYVTRAFTLQLQAQYTAKHKKSNLWSGQLIYETGPPANPVPHPRTDS